MLIMPVNLLTSLVLVFTLCSICLAQESVTKDYLTGKFNPSKDKRFVKIGEFFLRKEAAEAFLKMQKDAAKSKIKLTIVSGTRTFSDQKRLWENKWNGITPVNTDTNEFLPKPNSRRNTLSKEERTLRVLEFTAMPSTSRHHWGTDFDLNNVNLSYWAKPKGKKEYNWLVENAEKFGFCQVYSPDRTNGYKEEKWHWSYIPLAENFTNQYPELIKNTDIINFKFVGAETAATVDAVANFVLEINRRCK
jgi:zinc D-Ala-D-Ala carboxypeptidase